MLCINGSFPRLLCFTWIKLNDCDDVIILPLMNLVHMSLWYLYMYVTPCPMVMWLFQPYIQIFKCCFISGPVKSILRDPSLEENTSFFLKWFCCYLGVYLLQPRYILSANKLAPLPGNEWAYLPWENEKVEERFLWENRNFIKKKVVYLPWRLHYEACSKPKESF